jgi:hypothetical protein
MRTDALRSGLVPFSVVLTWLAIVPGRSGAG